MKPVLKWLGFALAAPALFIVGGQLYYANVVNPQVIRELHDDPDGDRAGQVMLLTLPSGDTRPVNYLRDGDTVYAAADFPWWRELRGGGGRGSVWIRGETLAGHIRAVEGDPEQRASVFARLRPDAASWAGTLIVVELDRP